MDTQHGPTALGAAGEYTARLVPKRKGPRLLDTNWRWRRGRSDHQRDEH